MQRPYALDLAFTAPGQPGRLWNAVACGAQRHDAFMHLRVGLAAGVAAGVLRQLDALPLPLAAILVVVAGHLQRQLQKHVLDRLQHHLCHALRLGGQVGQIDHARDSQARALGADRGHEAFGLGQRQAADAVDLLRNDDFTGLQVADHAQQLGAIGASARSLLAVDAGDVEAGGPGALNDGGLPGQVLLVGADAQVDARDLEGDAGGLVLGRFRSAMHHHRESAGSTGAVGLWGDTSYFGRFSSASTGPAAIATRRAAIRLRSCSGSGRDDSAS